MDVGEVFRTLSLPFETGFPAIVNGNFILEYETRRSLMNSPSKPLEKAWNESILEGCVLPCFVRFIERRVAELKTQYAPSATGAHLPTAGGAVSIFYEYFPGVNASEGDYWNGIGKKFFTQVSENNLEVLFVNKSCQLIPCAPKDDFLLYIINESPTQATPASFEASSFSSTLVFETTPQPQPNLQIYCIF